MPARQKKPIELYYWPTPNSWKISIMLEELKVPYNVNYVNIGKGEQFSPEFAQISPNNRVPAIIDPQGPDGEPITVFESGAILLYLAQKFGRFYPKEARARTLVDEWLMWQIAGLGPMSGQAGYFNIYAPKKIVFAIERYKNEVKRLYGVMNKHLEGRSYLADNYSIADMACVGWIAGHAAFGMDLKEFPYIKRWLKLVRERPAVQKGLKLGQNIKGSFTADRRARKILFGKKS
ncbi:MAG: Glutathione S-transferase [Candidatus Tokpelaia hoelldobleri]|uniref:Glutathione S-transferase n=1 Tax=Candidatus Tokpelaia hoelldobleri TaxID=1902579 RepID=A0A1U9JVT2_9HYPH|nr:MAG: Glutathione S-transferase [Candidatus Tokpelaia hoelldoblerii]